MRSCSGAVIPVILTSPGEEAGISSGAAVESAVHTDLGWQPARGREQESPISIELAELSPALGVEVRGVDLGRPLPEASLGEIRAAWDTHHLLLFRNQELTPEQQIRFIRHFGEPLVETLDASPFSYVSNVREDAIIRKGAIFFHSDLAFTPHPVRAISLSHRIVHSYLE